MWLFLKLGLRALKKNQFITLINTLGLAIGFTMVIFIGIYIQTEYSMDRFHEKRETLYRMEGYIENKNLVPISPAPFGPWLEDNFPEITASTRIATPLFSSYYISKETESFPLSCPFFVDPQFLKMFSFKPILGNPLEALKEKDAIILVESLSKKIFGEEDPMGKTIEINGKEKFTVRGVLKDVPMNSSIQFDLLLPFESCVHLSGFNDLSNWDNFSFFTFIESNSERRGLTQKINNVFREQNPPKRNEFLSKVTWYLNPLEELYFSGPYSFEFICKHGNKKALLIFLTIAIGVLLIAVANFINLSVAQNSLREREIGLKKMMGSTKGKLIFQLLFESVIISLIALVLAIILVELFIPAFNQLTDFNIDHGLIKEPHYWMVLLSGAITIGLLAGIYPAIILTRRDPIAVLKNNHPKGKLSKGLNRGTLIFQFSASMVLIISVLVISRQLSFINSYNLGFSKDQVLYFSLPKSLENHVEAFKNQLKQIPGVLNTGRSTSLPGKSYSVCYTDLETNGKTRVIQIAHNQVNGAYTQILGLNIVKGRTFDETRQTDQNSYLINEEAVHHFNLENPLEATLNGCEIIGVVKDFHFKSIHHKLEPLAIKYEDNFSLNFLVQADISQTASLTSIVSQIKNKAKEIDPGTLLDIHFLDDEIENLYLSELKTAKLIGYFSAFAILISCLGLFALVLHSLNLRIKEIGIRRVNGATVYELMRLLLGSFLKNVIIGFLIACPIAWFAMHRWLEGFAYKAPLSWWIFAASGLLTILIALISISWQTYRAATQNPIKALRYD